MESLMTTSAASTDFKSAVAAFLSGTNSDRVKVESRVPHVKVRRLLAQLLATEPGLEIERVVIRGFSGCSDFVGSVDVETKTGPAVFDFAWDCRWRAQSEGFVDYFGFPDQSRAAQEFDWQCFRQWERRATPR
jgi:hypothetical protein